MRRILSLGVGMVAFAGVTLPSMAADQPLLSAEPYFGRVVAAPIAVYNWTSCYIGGHVGSKWGNFTGSAAVAGFSPVSFEGGMGDNNNKWDSAIAGGGQIGCQWQDGRFVYGFEGDIGGADIGRTFTFPASFIPPPGNPFVAGDSVSFRTHWQASIRGRFGYTFDRWLVYGTAGVAFAEEHMSVGLVPTSGLPGVLFSEGGTAIGGTVGAGFDYAATDYVSFGLEYRYSKYGRGSFFGSAPFPVVGPLGPATAPLSGSSDFQTHELMARLNWHFNLFGPGPFAGRYY
jgi:outer membrane immunogenic protein